MHLRVIHAILAGLFLFCGSLASGVARAGDDQSPEDPPPDIRRVDPVEITFRLADGVRMSGTLTAWDRAGFDGSFGRRSWTELKLDDARRLFLRLMDPDEPRHWIELGRVLLQMPDGEEWAKLAFRRALGLDPEAEDAIKAVRRQVREMEAEKSEAQREATLASGSPEARRWPADAWPELSSQEQKAALTATVADGRTLARKATFELTPMLTDRFAIFSDLSRQELGFWTLRLDEVMRRILLTFGLDEEANPFWGRAVVLIFNDRDRFRLLQASEYKQFVGLNVDGITQYRGPKVFIALVRDEKKSDAAFKAALSRELVLAFLHRYRTPRRLPPWLHEGFAEYVAQRAYDDDPNEDGLRPAGLRHIRAGVNIGAVFDLTRDDQSWPGASNVGPAISHLMIEYLIERDVERFIALLDAVKDGADWSEAFINHFGMTRDEFIHRIVQFYMVND